MNTTKDHLLNIVNGPNRNELVDAFLYAYDGETGKKLCTFTLEDGDQKKQTSARIVRLTHTQHEASAQITEIEHEDGSGYSFNFSCYYTIGKISVHGVGYYNARTRKGWLKPTIN